ncbi:GNAT family N-acetyltransferase [Anaeromicrobium sediminis]|uniref:N-acetyltransferase domain-containing protein n=1 Tax=Anaeromicrobium sediminis TaxID=1478221 RepID=A0A267MIZ9_9FIRM|nr:GNAT family N-acetyltransferase [Anaeromicrobium sediminis]PAB59564.1 hypothetical protein CCE28_10145 [Anaeromicrobium sediminis]
MELNSHRLRLVPLTLKELENSLVDKELVERKAGLKSNGQLSNLMRIVYKIKINNIKKDPKNYLFYTYWQIILKEENRVVGRVGFKHIPDKDGKIEVGYGMEEEYRGKSYMTEALNTIIKWAFEQEETKSVFAVTQKHNVPSQRVLLKVGMDLYEEDEKFYKWILEKN